MCCLSFDLRFNGFRNQIEPNDILNCSEHFTNLATPINAQCSSIHAEYPYLQNERIIYRLIITWHVFGSIDVDATLIDVDVVK